MEPIKNMILKVPSQMCTMKRNEFARTSPKGYIDHTRQGSERIDKVMNCFPEQLRSESASVGRPGFSPSCVIMGPRGTDRVECSLLPWNQECVPVVLLLNGEHVDNENGGRLHELFAALVVIPRRHGVLVVRSIWCLLRSGKWGMRRRVSGRFEATPLVMRFPAPHRTDITRVGLIRNWTISWDATLPRNHPQIPTFKSISPQPHISLTVGIRRMVEEMQENS